MSELPTFWSWFVHGYNYRAGWKKFLDRWIVLHAAVGVALTALCPLPLRAAAVAVLLPLAGVFIGLSFAWVGNAQALLQSPEMSGVTKHHPGGFKEYVYTFQAAVLAILSTMVLWGLAGLGVFDAPCQLACSAGGYRAVEWALFFSASITVRECWHVVLGAQWMLLIQHEIRDEAVRRGCEHRSGQLPEPE